MTYCSYLFQEHFDPLNSNEKKIIWLSCWGIWSKMRDSFSLSFLPQLYNDKKGRTEAKTSNRSRQEVTPCVCQYVLCQDVLNVWMEGCVKCSRTSLVQLAHATKQRPATLEEHLKRTTPIPTEVRQTCSSLAIAWSRKLCKCCSHMFSRDVSCNDVCSL